MVHLLGSSLEEPATPSNEESVSSEDSLVLLLVTCHKITDMARSMARSLITGHTQFAQLNTVAQQQQQQTITNYNINYNKFDKKKQQ